VYSRITIDIKENTSRLHVNLVTAPKGHREHSTNNTNGDLHKQHANKATLERTTDTDELGRELSPKAKRLVKAVQLGDDLELSFVKCDGDSIPEPSKEESSSVGVVARDDEGDALKEFERGRGISTVRLKHQWDDVCLIDLIH
jgi:hypothetical protein